MILDDGVIFERQKDARAGLRLRFKKYRLQISNEFSDCVIPELLIENRQIVHATLSTRITARRAGYPDRWQGESAWVFPRCE
ncbi:hypothetical protein [Burkholderia ubonensis]|uniref:hypothetical protein n=1 Tax=Burkholderia ubonensis TaxID=101571 RepID=UPI00114D1680|nr:hypothetical protein [Burkholderia ubonensis]